MAKKTNNKKQPPKSLPGNLSWKYSGDIRIILDNLEKATGCKTKTAALLCAAEFYISDRKKIQANADDYKDRLLKAENELRDVRSGIRSFLRGLDELHAAIDPNGPDTGSTRSVRDEAEQHIRNNTVKCPCCGHLCKRDDLDDDDCPECAETVICPICTSVLIMDNKSFESVCPDCNWPNSKSN